MEHTMRISRFARLALALTAFCAAIMMCIAAPTAWADESLSELQQRVEATAKDYNDAQARLNELENEVAANEAKIEEINRALPSQQKNAADSMRILYIVQQESGSFIDIVLGSGNITDFFKTIEYLDCINEHNAAKIEKLARLKAELETAKTELDAALEEAQAETERAARALESAKAARKEAQEKAAAIAAQQAAAAAMAAERAAQAPASQVATPADAALQEPGVDAENPEVNLEPDTSGDVDGSVSADDVDWSADKSAFVSEWGSRIDSYLSGSNLGGYGRVFAESAWDYGVDPRWSPAISCIESGKGAKCFRSHNAWGWGSSSWGSWDEAIRAHVSGLARIYGYTITVEAARKYCPPSSTSWYNDVLEQMNQI